MRAKHRGKRRRPCVFTVHQVSLPSGSQIDRGCAAIVVLQPVQLKYGLDVMKLRVRHRLLLLGYSSSSLTLQTRPIYADGVRCGRGFERRHSVCGAQRQLIYVARQLRQRLLRALQRILDVEKIGLCHLRFHKHVLAFVAQGPIETRLHC